MTNYPAGNGVLTDEESSSPHSSVFNPINHSKKKPDIQLPDELWSTVLESTCTFPPEIFSKVMLNLIKNPNITSSHLFRADIFYDSENDQTRGTGLNGQPDNTLVKHLEQEYQPVRCELPEFELERTVVRQLVPRNSQLDKPLVQTCLFFHKLDDQEEKSAIMLIPHAKTAQELPFYHPAVSRVAFMHIRPAVGSEYEAATTKQDDIGSISISYCLFPGTTLTTKLERTALRLLQTIHKHGQGQLAGYEKRVQLDQVITQKRYQDTYARLKAKYGKQLAEQWVEVTDPGKHVFEDIGIAAFLIELWRDMYCDDKCQGEDETKPHFRGFVDIGCGNGVLVYVLLAEGYDGWGFDARERKTWRVFPDDVQARLLRRVLVPNMLETNALDADTSLWHNGSFDPGTFIISNHADELTAWTPILAYLNQSSFIAIPCCSHDLSGARFRAPGSTKAAKQRPARLPQQHVTDRTDTYSNDTVKSTQAAESGSLNCTEAQKKMPSAYSSLCSYVASLAEEVGFKPEKEVLRIPSTRNQCIIGRQTQMQSPLETLGDADARKQTAVGIVEREVGRSVEAVSTEWIERVEKLAKKPGSGH